MKACCRWQRLSPRCSARRTCRASAARGAQPHVARGQRFSDAAQFLPKRYAQAAGASRRDIFLQRADFSEVAASRALLFFISSRDVFGMISLCAWFDTTADIHFRRYRLPPLRLYFMPVLYKMFYAAGYFR